MTAKQSIKLERFIEAGAYFYISVSSSTFQGCLREAVLVSPGVIVLGPLGAEDQHDIKAIDFDEVTDPHDLALEFLDENYDRVLYITTLEEAGLEDEEGDRLRVQLKTIGLQRSQKTQAWQDWTRFWEGQVENFRRSR